mmetsp:Transcript_13207/g.22464  ORF Transcript_13207/g.22464 Transcript_13207/m.22464 type:complete len:85 (+) Transcript_13207:671-925(+)
MPTPCSGVFLFPSGFESISVDRYFGRTRLSLKPWLLSIAVRDASWSIFCDGYDAVGGQLDGGRLRSTGEEEEEEELDEELPSSA